MYSCCGSNTGLGGWTDDLERLLGAGVNAYKQLRPPTVQLPVRNPFPYSSNYPGVSTPLQTGYVQATQTDYTPLLLLAVGAFFLFRK